jgi:hypothetical protein
MIKFEHDGLHISFQRTMCWKEYGGANAPNKILKSNHLLFDELFKQKNKYELRMKENHMPV